MAACSHVTRLFLCSSCICKIHIMKILLMKAIAGIGMNFFFASTKMLFKASQGWRSGKIANILY